MFSSAISLPFVLGHALELETELDVPQDRTPRIKDRNTGRRRRGRARAVDCDAVDDDASSIRLYQPIDDAQQGRFSAAARAYDRHKLTLGDGKVDAVEDLDADDLVFCFPEKDFFDFFDEQLWWLRLHTETRPS